MFRSSRPDYIETVSSPCPGSSPGGLFRSSRPDYIETLWCVARPSSHRLDCSGLPGRTTLRQSSHPNPQLEPIRLFRSSRPDYIETPPCVSIITACVYCSGLPGRTTLRHSPRGRGPSRVGAHCSGLPGRTTLRPVEAERRRAFVQELFRSSRPDYIETWAYQVTQVLSRDIVPVFQTGLH